MQNTNLVQSCPVNCITNVRETSQSTCVCVPSELTIVTVKLLYAKGALAVCRQCGTHVPDGSGVVVSVRCCYTDVVHMLHVVICASIECRDELVEVIRRVGAKRNKSVEVYGTGNRAAPVTHIPLIRPSDARFDLLKNTPLNERHRCAACGRCDWAMKPRHVERRFRGCAVCKKVAYCSSECQAKDWNNHRATCKPTTVNAHDRHSRVPLFIPPPCHGT